MLPQPTNQVQRIDIIYIITNNETDTIEYRAHIQNALDFWKDSIVIGNETTITSDAPYVYEYEKNSVPTLYFVIGSKIEFAGQLTSGVGWKDYALVSTDQGMSLYPYTIRLEAAIAHELGHALYNLPDLYFDHSCAEITDIMCSAAPAYNARWIGCITLEKLGRPCHFLFLSSL